MRPPLAVSSARVRPLRRDYRPVTVIVAER
jgi:hypothetical protein